MKKIRLYRIISQLVFLLAFLYLVLKIGHNTQDNILNYTAKLYFHLSPFQFFTVLFSLHTFLLICIPALIILLASIFLGRFFCGWICPLGTVIQFSGNILDIFKKKKIQKYDKKQKGKYYLLFLLVFLSFFGIVLFGLFDPLSILKRSLSLGIGPASQPLIEKGLIQLITGNSGSLSILGRNTMGFLRDTVFFTKESTIYYKYFFLGAFLLILFSTIIKKRFWCRYICPAGALMGLLGRLGPLSLQTNDRCTHCAACSLHCEGACNPHIDKGWISEECTMCFNCIQSCPQKGLSFGYFKKLEQPKLDLTRRHLLTSGLFGAVTIPFLHFNHKRSLRNPFVIRPPGSKSEKDFLSLCIRCGTCMKACPTKYIQPSLFESGITGVFSPICVPKIGYCNYQCTMCGQVCPTEAITHLSNEEKQKTKIGTAQIDEKRCLPHAYGVSCLMCEEHCPVPTKAIHAYKEDFVDEFGNKTPILKPYVIKEDCIGCGICENVCPSPGGIAAIKVYNTNRFTQSNKTVIHKSL